MNVPARRFGRYVLLAELGRGGMGMVFRARCTRSGRDVALKVLGSAVTGRALERFRREGELTAALRHPGIVRIHDAGEDQGRPFLAYELIEGPTLEDALPQLDRPRRLEVLQAVAHAVAHAHGHGVVHRDLKPENVLLDLDHVPYVADFGLAWVSSQERLTQTHGMVGTPFYMAPEQFSGEATPACDVWSLGVILYRALSDELPFDAGSVVELAAQIQRCNPGPLRAIDPGISPALETVCLTALQRQPSLRYPSAAEFAADLDAALTGRPISASASRLRLRSALRRRGGLLLAGLALAVAGGVVVLALQFSPTPRAKPAPAPRSGSPARGPLLEQAFALIDEGNPEDALALLDGDDASSVALRCEALIDAGRVKEAAGLLTDLPAAQVAVLSAAVDRARGEDVEPVLQAARTRWSRDPAVLEALTRHLILEGEWQRALSALRAGQDVPSAPRLAALRAFCSAIDQGLNVPGAPRKLREAAAAALIRDAREQVYLGARYPDGPRTPLERWERATRQLNLAYNLAQRRGPLAGAALAGLGSVGRHRGLRVLPERIQHAADLAPNDPWVATEQAFTLAATDPRAALTALDRAPSASSEAQLARGLALIYLGQEARAVQLLRGSGHRDDPRRLPILSTLADKLGPPEEARRLARALEQLGEDQAAADRRAEDIRGEGNPAQEALRLLDELLREAPLAPRARYLRAVALLDLGRTPQGTSELLSALHDNPWLFGRAGAFHLREVAKLESTGVTKSPLRELIELRGPDPRADPYERGLIYAALAEFSADADRPRWIDGGLEDLSKVISLEPTALLARLLRASLWLRAGRLERCARDLDVVADATPQDSAVAFYRALLLAAREAPLAAVREACLAAEAAGYEFPFVERAAALYPELEPYLGEDGLLGAPFWR